MIVEDHSAFARAPELILGQVEGAEVVLDRTLEEGRALIRGGEPFDVAVLDLTLPDGEGTDLIAELSSPRGLGSRRSSLPGTATPEAHAGRVGRGVGVATSEISSMARPVEP